MYEIFALGAAKGKLILDNRFRARICFRNSDTATVFLLAVTYLEIFEFFFLFSIKVSGPGQNFLYKLLNILFSLTVFV